MGRLFDEIRKEIRAEQKRQKSNEKENKEEIKNKIGIEDLLIELRKKEGLTIVELLEKLNDSNLKEKDIKNWEIGLKYPDLDTIYKLSEIYRIPSTEFVKAKNNSYENGLAGINKKIIRWFVYTLNVSFYIGVVFTTILYVVIFILALCFFVTVAYQVKAS